MYCTGVRCSLWALKLFSLAGLSDITNTICPLWAFAVQFYSMWHWEQMLWCNIRSQDWYERTLFTLLTHGWAGAPTSDSTVKILAFKKYKLMAVNNCDTGGSSCVRGGSEGTHVLRLPPGGLIWPLAAAVKPLWTLFKHCSSTSL